MASGASASPEDEDELLDAAKRESMSSLRKKAAESRARADRDEEARRRRQRTGQAVRPEKKVLATVDLAAPARGRVDGDEACEIAGVGSVSLPVLRSLLSDAAIAVVIRDGVDVLNVTHLGRQVTAHLRTAMEARGYRCEVEGCGATSQLEMDHVEGFSLTRQTRLDDLAWWCHHDQDRKTYEDLVLAGPVGRRRLVPRAGPADEAHHDESALADDPTDDIADGDDGQYSLAL